MDQARKALRYCLDNLGANDRFALINFATTVNRYEDKLLEVSKEQLDKAKKWVDELEATGGLRADLSINDAADIIWATNSSEFFLLLVHDRNWDAGRFEQWLARTWTELLLKPPT